MENSPIHASVPVRTIYQHFIENQIFSILDKIQSSCIESTLVAVGWCACLTSSTVMFVEQGANNNAEYQTTVVNCRIYLIVYIFRLLIMNNMLYFAIVCVKTIAQLLFLTATEFQIIFSIFCESCNNATFASCRGVRLLLLTNAMKQLSKWWTKM